MFQIYLSAEWNAARVWSYKEFIQIHMFYCFMLFETWSLVCLGRDTADKRVNRNKRNIMKVVIWVEFTNSIIHHIE